ncbi:MAG: hypothetical protein P4M09_21205 [Devosia sp.]|nr:hypothetical protein [Devosia sp.]
MPAVPSRKLNRADSSKYLLEIHGLSYKPNSLARLAISGKGPAFYPVPGSPLYSTDDLDAWAREVLGEPVYSTAEAKQQRGAA